MAADESPEIGLAFNAWLSKHTTTVAAAGVNLANVTPRKPKNLDRESMLLWLRNRQSAGQSLIYSEVCIENRAYALAIRREFGSWGKAISEVTSSISKEES